jgi:CTP synthase
MTRFIFITGGVVSSLGKGLCSAALGALLQNRGFKVRLRKLDPYLNVDPGTMSPYQHGEVYVTDDGAETDLDLGHYERFTGVATRKSDNVTTGQIYTKVLARERRGDYLGATVQVIPHVTDAIKEFIVADVTDEDFVVCEVGGTVGDIEGLPFLEAIRQMGNELGPERTLFMHVTLVPYIKAAGELKTKPTQHSVKELQGMGIKPDILVCRSEQPIELGDRRKIAQFCNVRPEAVIPALDVDSIYAVPRAYHAEGLDNEVLRHFKLEGREPDLAQWDEIVRRVRVPDGAVTIGVVGKYTSLLDAYKSLAEALAHGGIANNVKVRINWLDSEIFEKEEEALHHLEEVNGILVPGGFGERGSEGKIKAAGFARVRQVPYFGICFGMQMAVIEAARTLGGLSGADSTEFGPSADPVVGLMTEWTRGNQVERRNAAGDLGGTMRLGAYPCQLAPGSRVREIYGQDLIYERHRHRYEVNINYRAMLEGKGLRFSGLSPDGELPEIVEIPDHPWFVGVQFHPELKSKPFDPHPLFTAFIKAAVEKARLV